MGLLEAVAALTIFTVTDLYHWSWPVILLNRCDVIPFLSFGVLHPIAHTCRRLLR